MVHVTPLRTLALSC